MASQIGDRLKAAREVAGLTQAAAGELLGVNAMTISKRERGDRGISAEEFERVLAAYRAYAESGNGLGQSVPRGTVGEAGKAYGTSAGDEDSWSPNPALTRKIPKRAYDVAIAYCTRLQTNGWPREEIEQIERLMIDPRYAQANKRKGLELSEDDHIMLVDATWEAVKATAAALGRQV